MEPSLKKVKLEAPCEVNPLIRLSDSFVRTDGNVICPVIKAENSIRVLHKLQNELFTEILTEAERGFGLKQIRIDCNVLTGPTMINGNLFIMYEASRRATDENLEKFVIGLTAILREKSKVRHVLVEVVKNMDVFQQPFISEIDFDIYKLKLCYKMLSESTEHQVLETASQFIESTINEQEEHYTKIAVLSQNGKGKSFFLNLLLLLTSDNEEEYRENNKDLKLPQDINGSPTVKELMEMKEIFSKLPEVVREFVKRNCENEEEDFKTTLNPIFHVLDLNTQEEAEKSNKSFKSLSGYFKAENRLKIEPYLLAQKTLQKSYESTTKCIVHLRYGTVYQLKVEYFRAEDLQAQLFELVLLLKNEPDTVPQGVNKEIRERSCECLKARFKLLTEAAISDIDKDLLSQFKTSEDIALSEAVKTFAGKTELYVGNGKNLASDRQSMQTVLKHLTTAQFDDCENLLWKPKIAAIKKIIVYVPSKILCGGKEILEMPGIDDSDPMAMEFIYQALNTVHALFVMSDFAFKIGEKEVKELLRKSEFIHAWKRNPEFYSLMFLAYPEKDSNFQFGENMTEIQALEGLEDRKRSTEIEELCNLLTMNKDTLTAPMVESIFTSYVLPVLHTSILMQEGLPNTIITANADFLKYTGIDNLISYLDNFISVQHRDSIHQAEKYLKYMKNIKPEMRSTSEGATFVLNLLKNKELKSIHETILYDEYHRVLLNLRKQLMILYTNELASKMDSLLASLTQDAKQRWEKNENSIIARGMFHPLYCGNHSTYKVRISNILFHTFELQKTSIFDFLLEKVNQLLLKYQNEVLELFTKQIKNLWPSKELENVDLSTVVKQSIEHPLNEAAKWYIGKYKNPLSKRTVGKYLDESRKSNLRKHILIPAYKTEDLDEAKQKAKQNIEKAIMSIKGDFIESILELHETRWKSFTSHLYTRYHVPSLWVVLLSHLKEIAPGTQVSECQMQLARALELISTKLKN